MDYITVKIMYESQAAKYGFCLCKTFNIKCISDSL